MQLTIIIVNYNTQALLRNCLQSLFQHENGDEFEVLVVDNGSTDGSREMLTAEFPQVGVILNSVNKGFAAANNQALKMARGDYLLLLNSDTIIFDNVVTQCLRFLQRHAEVHILGCKLLNPDKTLQPSCRSFPSAWNVFVESFFLYRLFKRTKLFGNYYMSHFAHDSNRQVDVVMGAFMLIRKEVFTTIGLFDEDFFMYAEETDFCYRAHLAGFNTFFFADAAVIHLGGGSAHDSQQFFAQLHSALLLFFHKHFRGPQLWAAVGLKNLGVAFRVIVYFLSGTFTFDLPLLKKAWYYLRLLI